jgi:predicted RNA-binding protein with PUA-like domain
MRAAYLLKSEPFEYSVDDLARQVIGRWDGVRNYQARNYLREMKAGEKLFFYHSNCKEPGIYGIMTVAKEAYPDPTAIDSSSKYYDPKSSEEKNRWTSIDVKFGVKYENPLLLNNLKNLPLGTCPLTAKGNRLSVFPLTDEQVKLIEQTVASIDKDHGKRESLGGAVSESTSISEKKSRKRLKTKEEDGIPKKKSRQNKDVS